jgi:hypothetical protein
VDKEVKMKRILILCAVLLISTASTTYAIPLTNIDDPAFFNDVGRVEFTRIADLSALPDNFRFDALNGDSNLKDFSFYLTRWASPSWFKSAARNGIGMKKGGYLDHPYLPREIPPRGEDDGPGETPNSIPEPATMLLFGTGLIGLAMIARKERKM